MVTRLLFSLRFQGGKKMKKMKMMKKMNVIKNKNKDLKDIEVE